MLHGSSQSGAAMLNAGFAGELFGPGQPLDAAKYYIILPERAGPRPNRQSRRTG